MATISAVVMSAQPDKKIYRIPECTVAQLRQVLGTLPNDASVKSIAPPGNDMSGNIQINAAGEAFEIVGYWHEDDDAIFERDDVVVIKRETQD